MSKLFHGILTVLCITGGFIAAGYHGYKIHSSARSFDELLAPIVFNIEISKEAAGYVAVQSKKNFFSLASTANGINELNNTVLYSNFPSHNEYRNFSLSIAKEHTAEVLAAIDNITVFVGNKTIYYSADDVQRLVQTGEQHGHALFALPDLYYVQSRVIKDLANWYGDGNLIIRAFLEFFVYPAKFIGAWFFLVCLFFLHKDKIMQFRNTLNRQSPGSREILLIVLILLFGLMMRLNGYVRYSNWADELYSAVTAGNPTKPFMQTFVDPGNPPFYFMLLRWWFLAFGWSEESGTMLSVIMGTGAIVSLYCLVRKHLNAKMALLTAFFMAISAYAIGYSQEMRGYILKIILAPLISLLFLDFLKKPVLGKMILYMIPCILLANTHYYGVIFVAAHFLLFLGHRIITKNFRWKTTIMFLCGNIITGISFIPFLMITGLNNLSRSSGQSDMAGALLRFGFVILTITIFAVWYVRAGKVRMFKGFFNKEQQFFLEYAACCICSMFFLVFMFSFFIPIYNEFPSYRYFAICFPYALIFAALAVYMVSHHQKLRIFSLFLFYALVLALYEARPGGSFGWYRECRAYIAADTAAHPEKKAAVFGFGWDGIENDAEYTAYYGFTSLPTYSPGGDFDTVYILNGPFDLWEEDIYAALEMAGLETPDVLKVRINEERIVLKVPLKK